MIRLKDSVVRLIAFVVVISVAGTVCFCFGEEAEKLLYKITVLSVQGYLPIQKKETADVIEQQPLEAETSVTVTTESVIKTDVTAKPEEKDELTETDPDIIKIIKSAQKAASKDKKDGEIREYTFTTDGVTDSFKNVRVKNTNKTQIDIKKKLGEKLSLTLSDDKPSVLIYHTHTTETYQLLDRNFYARGFLSRSTDAKLNMIRVGKAVAAELEKNGYKVIHDTAVYDSKYTGAYYRSEDAAKKYLKQYPSIQITLDIHRDAIQNNSGVKTKPVAVINGKKAAQIMIITGCQEEGNGITDLPLWEKNLTFALRLQQSMETLFPGVTRPVFFCDRSYNMGLTPCSLLVEVGSDANTLEEAVYSGKMLGRALAKLLDEHKKEN